MARKGADAHAPREARLHARQGAPVVQACEEGPLLATRTTSDMNSPHFQPW